MKSNIKISLLIIVAVLCYISYIFVQSKKQEKQLINTHKLTQGRIIDLGESAGRVQISPEFKFVLEDKEYKVRFNENKFCKHLSNKDKRNLMSVPVLVAYYPPNPYISDVILTQKDLKKFNVSYPYTLSPILKRQLECK
ncbi:MAG: hypothetical protein ACK4TA_10150 [Saprospiraceae bacterium]